MPRKKKASEVIEELEATGQESDTKAAKWVIEKGKEEEKEFNQQQADKLDKLTSIFRKGQIITYKDAVYVELKRQMINCYDLLPEGFAWLPEKTDQGIALWIRDQLGSYHAHGMLVSNVPEYDLNCIDRIIDKALVYMEQIDISNQKGSKTP